MVARSNQSFFGSWWWTVDRPLILATVILVFVGIVMAFAASPPAAQALDRGDYFFVAKHLLVLIPATFLFILCAFMVPRGVLRLGVALLAVSGMLLVCTVLFGQEVKGASRWLEVAGWRLQPSEFAKPGLVIVTAYWLCREPPDRQFLAPAGLVCIIIALLLAQPDLGMSVLILATAAVQIFIAGISWAWVLVGATAGVALVAVAYVSLPHVRSRIDGFMDPNTEVYQVERALSALSKGGLWGVGPGEGTIKYRLPEAHSDFVFATVAEEFGVLVCLLIVLIFLTLVARAMIRAIANNDPFVQIAAGGIAASIALQSLVNMAVNLNLVPTKGMTLPFVSYGGSSMIALAISMGMLVALTRRDAQLNLRSP